MKQASQKEHTLYDTVYGLKPGKTKIKSVKRIVITIRGNNDWDGLRGDRSWTVVNILSHPWCVH